jgi:hypothetical protein
VLVVVLLSACGSDEPVPAAGDPTWRPPAEQCDDPIFDDLSSVPACSTGSGSFGRWASDALGLVAYDYRLDQHADARAAYPVTEVDAEGTQIDRRDHWSAFGNRRVNAWLNNDGAIEVVTQDRGVEYLNKIDADGGAHGGGFGWLSDGTEHWCTAYANRPAAARTTRRFGMGYGETSMEHRDVRVRRVTASPPGLAPVVISDVSFENLSAAPKTLSHWEYWDVARRSIEISWLVSGSAFTHIPKTTREQRDARNALFDETAHYQPSAGLLWVARDWAGAEPRLAVSAPSAVDHYANTPFLAALTDAPRDVWVDQAAFFGDGGVALPDAVRTDAGGMGGADGVVANGNGADQPLVLVMRHDFDLAPGAQKTLRFAYGYARSGEAPQIDAAWRDPNYSARQEYASALQPRLVRFAAEGEAVLTRELLWHSYQLETSVGYRDYFQGAVVPQGSAYLYLHGADGAARDLGLFAVPLVYSDPELARAELRLFMGVQHADERFSYAFQGHGMLDDASIHTAPSDLPLFFLWALGEYVGATGDEGFLDAAAPYYPRDARPNAQVWDHLVGALRHQFDVVGTGEHGLIRVQTGDWSDGIVVSAPDRALAIEKGESVPNTQLAVAVLPRIADLVAARDPALAAEIRDKVLGYRAALKEQWRGAFFSRAYFGDGEPVDADRINLEAQIWALIGDTFESPEQRATLVTQIAEQLDDPSPTGATLLPGEQVWPAISAPLTWGYALSDPERAFRHFRKNTLAAHAQAFPDVWYGIWSGPDGTTSSDGYAWSSQVTPMTDFPVQNNNAHAMPILAAIRLLGIDARADGLHIRLPPVGRRLSIDTALVALDAGRTNVRLRYRARAKRLRRVQVDAPAGHVIASAEQDGAAVALPPNTTSHVFDADFAARDELDLRLVLSP